MHRHVAGLGVGSYRQEPWSTHCAGPSPPETQQKLQQFNADAHGSPTGAHEAEPASPAATGPVASRPVSARQPRGHSLPIGYGGMQTFKIGLQKSLQHWVPAVQA